MRKKLYSLLALVVVAATTAGWFLHRPLLARYYVHRLKSSADEAMLNRVADQGQASVKPLVELLKQDAPACQNSAQALQRILDRLPPDDPRTAQVARALADSFAQFSGDGKEAVLELAGSWQTQRSDFTDTAGRIVQEALKDDQVSIQVKAIILALKPEMGMAGEVAPLLKDPKPEVRRAAILAIGPFRDLVPDDDLLPCLHDADEEVRQRCEMALKARGLRDKDVLLGRLITDSSPLKRLEVIRFLPNDAELDPKAWLSRLCQDSSPVVRATAARYALDPAAEVDVDLTPRVRQMAQSDPDGTVRQIADFLIRQSRVRLQPR
jgi:HEAT repeats